MDDWQLQPAKDIGITGLERCAFPQRESGLVESTLRFGWWTFLRTTFRVWNRLTILGREHLPSTPPMVLVANHSSHLDALLLTTFLPLRWRDRTFPMAARDVFFERLSLATFSAAVINSLPVARGTAGRHTLKTIRERMVRDACVMILFPEGTRSRTGNLNSFKPGIGMLVAGTPVPVVPFYIEGAFAALPPQHRWVRPGKITITIGPAHQFAAHENRRAGWEACAAQMEAAVLALAPAQATIRQPAANEQADYSNEERNRNEP